MGSTLFQAVSISSEFNCWCLLRIGELLGVEKPIYLGSEVSTKCREETGFSIEAG